MKSGQDRWFQVLKGLAMGLVAVLGVAVLVLLAGNGQAQAAIPFVHDTIPIDTPLDSFGNQRDFDVAGTNGQHMVACYWYDNFNSWRVSESHDQGNTWAVSEYFNDTDTILDIPSGFTLVPSQAGGCGVAISDTGNWVGILKRQQTQANTNVLATVVGSVAGPSDEFDFESEGLELGGSAKVYWVGGNSFKYPHWRNKINDTEMWLWVSTSTDNGQSWTHVNTTIFKSDSDGYATAYASFDGTTQYLFWESAGDDLIVWRSTDSGSSWSSLATVENNAVLLNYADVDAHMTTSTVIYAAGCTSFSNQCRVFKSTNGGSDWDNKGCVFASSSRRINIGFNSTTDGFVGYGSTNGGASFKITNDGFETACTSPGWSSMNGVSDAQSEWHQIVPSVYGYVGGNTSSGLMEFVKQRAPPPGVVNSRSTYGNAQAARVDWTTSNNVFVRDISGLDNIEKLTPSLGAVSNRNFCQGDVTPSVSFWQKIKILFWGIDDLEELALADNDAIGALEATRNGTGAIISTCDGTATRALSGVGESEASVLLMSRLDLTPLNVYQTNDTTAPIRIDAYDNLNHVIAVTGGTVQNGLGHWFIVAEDEIYRSNTGDLPRWTTIKDVATDKKISLVTRNYCATSTANGTTCFNENGGQTSLNASLFGNYIQAFDGNIYLDNCDAGGVGTCIGRYLLSGGSFILQAENTDPTLVNGLRISKDGAYLYALDETGGTNDQIAIYDSSTLELISRSGTISTGLRDTFDVDKENNFAYVVDTTTVYQVGIFNHTTSLGNPNIVGTQNPGIDDVLAPDDDPGLGDGGGGGDGGDGGLGSGVPAGSPFDVSVLNSFTGSTTASGLLMAALAIMLGGGLGSVATGGFSWQMGILGGVAGFVFAVGVSWVPAWMVAILFLMLVIFLVTWVGRGN